jgi:hypothetical protein
MQEVFQTQKTEANTEFLSLSAKTIPPGLAPEARMALL